MTDYEKGFDDGHEDGYNDNPRPIGDKSDEYQEGYDAGGTPICKYPRRRIL